MSTRNGSTKTPASGSSKAATAPEEPPKNRPAHEIRLGRIKATIWANQADNGPWFNVTLSRNYKDGDEWKSSASFGRDELLSVAKVADMANTWIHSQSQGSSTGGRESDAGEEEIPY